MTTTLPNGATPRRALRLWPGVVAAILMLLFRYVVAPIVPDVELFSLPLGVVVVFLALFCAAAIVVWWLFFSRAAWLERVGAIVLMIGGIALTFRFVHESIAGGMMGSMLPVYSFPILCAVLVAWAAATRNLPDTVRRVSMVGAIALALVPWTLIRTAGVFGAGGDFHWRWTETPEERLLAQVNDEPKAPPPAAPAAAATEPAVSASSSPAAPKAEDKAANPARAEATAPSGTPAAVKPEPVAAAVPIRAPEWPGFRGPSRDGIAHGVRLDTNWSQSPPVQLWRRPIGPGWSSFAVQGDLLYTQEQRGDDEIVACYRLSTGEPVWRHRDPARFWESNGGAGPRGTPTLSNGRVYAFGATGILNALDARTGKLAWSRNVAADAKKAVPFWGFTSSPLVLGDLVVVAASGRLVAYDVAGGAPRWLGPASPGSYSSPHLVTIDGVTQIMLLHAAGVTSVAPADGTVLWQHAWDGATTIVQPAMTADGDVVINAIAATGGIGTRRLAVQHAAGGWNVQERWTSTGLKPYFNDFVIHKGHAYGFDGSILACIDLNDGARKWKGGRYGNGQLMLLPDQDLLLVLSEEGELALVSATTDQFKEVARFPALNAKTWNHPVLVRDTLLVRNGEEMAAFKLPVAGR